MGDPISLLVWLLIAVVVGYILFFLLSKVQMDSTLRTVITLIIVVIILIFLLRQLGMF